MKSLAFISLLFLVVPGSGQLVFDGLPLSTRAEFVALAVLVLAILSRSVRTFIHERLSGANWQRAAVPLVGIVVLLKVLTFAWLPFADGFSACYRSLYYPVADSERCEESYEAPFLRNGIVIDNASRIDRTVDFGTHLHDWSLPFMNEYPRLSALWLERFPFTAQYGAVVRNDTADTRFLPIYGNGEISGRVNQESFSTEALPLVDRYEFPRLNIVGIPSGVSEIAVNYRFSDDDATEPPDVKPPLRGPYATLKIGNLQSRKSLLDFAQVRVRGWTVDTARQDTPDYVVALDQDGNELARSEPQERPDVAAYVELPSLTLNGFNFAFPATALNSGEVDIAAVYSGQERIIGSLAASANFVPDLPLKTLVPSLNDRSDFQVWFDADRGDFSAMAPEYQGRMSLGLRTLLLFLDGIMMLIVGSALVAVILALRRSLLAAIGLGVISVFTVVFGPNIAPEILGSRLFLPILLVSTLVVLVGMRFPLFPLVTYLPIAVVLAVHKSFDQLERFHGSRGERWWGRLLFYWRDSDWFATQGYARTVFLEGSLRGGEAVFWFQAGPRYLAFVTRMLLGENDVLVGILMTTLGFFAVFAVYLCSRRFLTNLSLMVSGGLVLFVLLFFMADDLMAGFGFVGSSEYPTWIALLFITGFVATTRGETRSWLLVGMSIALGYSIQMRPNQVGGVVFLFVALLLLIERSDRARAVTTASKMVLAFLAIALFSLIHNLYYGESFVLFTANAGINYAFSWRDVLGIDSGDAGWSVVWGQARFMMYWNAIGNYSWALMFWGSQFCWLGVVANRLRHRLALRARSLYLLIPFGYAVPMLKYQMTSYYPRHLVAINLSFLCAALMAWPRKEEAVSSNDEPPVAGGDELAARRDVAAAPAAFDGAVSGVNS